MMCTIKKWVIFLWVLSINSGYWVYAEDADPKASSDDSDLSKYIDYNKLKDNQPTSKLEAEKMTEAQMMFTQFERDKNRFVNPFSTPYDANHFSSKMKPQIQAVYRQAWLSAYEKNYREAEHLYNRILGMDITPDQKRNLLLEIAAMYEKEGDKAKKAAVYEKFIEQFPKDPILPAIYIELGQLYRDLGDNKQAINKFYFVINASLGVPEDLLPAYKVKTLEAQMEIAETYFLNNNYKEAEKFFDRLKLLNLTTNERMIVEFKLAYIKFVSEDYVAAISSLKDFISKYPMSTYVPEARFMLSDAYSKLNRNAEAINEVLILIQESHDNIRVQNQELWLYWRKRAGNKLGNQLYNEGEYLEALKIYQAMAKLNNTPDWQWPIIYQIALCFERLGMYTMAKKAYEILATGKDWNPDSYKMTDELKVIQDMAKWKLDHNNWRIQTQEQIDEILYLSK